MVRGRTLLIGGIQGRTECYLPRGDETVCTKIPRKEQRVHAGVLEHDAQETAAIFSGSHIGNAICLLMELKKQWVVCVCLTAGHELHDISFKLPLHETVNLVQAFSKPCCLDNIPRVFCTAPLRKYRKIFAMYFRIPGKLLRIFIGRLLREYNRIIIAQWDKVDRFVRLTNSLDTNFEDSDVH